MEPAINRRIPDVIICDDFYESPLDVRQFALSQGFSYHPGDHKGQRTDQRFCFPGVKDRLEHLLGASITNWDKHGYNGVFQFCVAGDQLVYHADGQSYAAVVYLTPDAPPSAGTTLYRSKATGLRTVNQQTALSKGLTLEQAAERTFNKKLLDPTAWETVDVIGNVFNRCAIWNAQLIHAASNYFGTNKHDGRLFQMFFFDIDRNKIRSIPLPPRETARAAGIQPATLMPPVQGTAKLKELIVPAKIEPRPPMVDPISEKAVPLSEPITPEQLLKKAGELCQLLLGLPENQVITELAKLEDENPVLAALVRRNYSEASKQARTNVGGEVDDIRIPPLEPGRRYTQEDIDNLAKPMIKHMLTLPPTERMAWVHRVMRLNVLIGQVMQEHLPAAQEPNDEPPGQ